MSGNCFVSASIRYQSSLNILFFAPPFNIHGISRPFTMTQVWNYRCAVPKCHVRQDVLPSLKIHRFPNPKQASRREKWLRFCLFDSDPGDTPLNICSAHFPDDAYQPQYRLLGRERKDWRLSMTSVPTLLPPSGFVPEEFTEIIEEVE